MAPVTQTRLSANQRILETAYQLFRRRRIRDVGINEVIAQAEVSKATFYSHFPSKDDLVLAFLDLREQRATIDWLATGIRERGGGPEERLLAVFDIFDEWFCDEQFESCPFIHVLLEMGPGHPLGKASIRYLGHVRGMICDLAREAELRDPETFARSFHLLMKGAIVTAVEGDTAAAGPAKELARALIEQHRPGLDASGSARGGLLGGHRGGHVARVGLHRDERQ